MHIKIAPAATTLALITLLAACASAAPSAGTTSALLRSVQASTADDSVHFLMQVTNPDSTPVVLEFASQPIFYFTVDRNGLLLWNSAEESDRTPAMATDTLHGGDTRSFRASWAVPIGLRGTLTVTGVLRDHRRPIVQSTDFLIK